MDFPIAVIAVVTTVIVLIMTSNHGTGTAKAATCDAQAVKQLPPAVVKNVEESQKARNVPADVSEVLAVRKIDANWEARAFVEFLPRY